MASEVASAAPPSEPPTLGELRSSFQAALSAVCSHKSTQSKEGKVQLWSIFDSLTERLVSRDTEIQVLKGKLEERQLSQTTPAPKSWSGVVKAPPPPKPSEAKKVVLIYPKAGKEFTSEEVKRKLQTELNPTELKINVSKIRKVNHGGVMIECEKEAQAGRLTEAISANPELADLAPRPPRRRLPKVVLYNISKDCTKEELNDQLIKHNGFLEGNIELLFPIKGKNGKAHWVAQVKPECFAKLKKKGKLNLLWEVHTVREYFRETRCFKCCGFGHFQARCPEKDQVCARCGEAGHKHQECKAEKPSCVNCTKANRKLKLKEKLDTAHSSLNRKCPCVIRELDRVKAHIQYD